MWCASVKSVIFFWIMLETVGDSKIKVKFRPLYCGGFSTQKIVNNTQNYDVKKLDSKTGPQLWGSKSITLFTGKTT